MQNSTKPIKEEAKHLDDSIFHWLHNNSERSINYQRNRIQLSRDLIHNRYFDTFNFYFSKPINEILVDVRLPHVILLKDFGYYDDETEYLKRYYKCDETKPRIENITKFYSTFTEAGIRPTLLPNKQSEMLLKRNEEHNQLLIAKLQKLAPPTLKESNQVLDMEENKENKGSRLTENSNHNNNININNNNNNNAASNHKEAKDEEEKKQPIEVPRLIHKEEANSLPLNPVKDVVANPKNVTAFKENIKIEEKPIVNENSKDEGVTKEKKWLNKFKRFGANEKDDEEFNQNFFKKYQTKIQPNNDVKTLVNPPITTAPVTIVPSAHVVPESNSNPFQNLRPNRDSEPNLVPKPETKADSIFNTNHIPINKLQPQIKKEEPIKATPVEEKKLKTEVENHAAVIAQKPPVEIPVHDSDKVNNRVIARNRRREIRSDIIFGAPRASVQPSERQSYESREEETSQAASEKEAPLKHNNLNNVGDNHSEQIQQDQRETDLIKELEAMRKTPLPDNVSFSKKEIGSQKSEESREISPQRNEHERAIDIIEQQPRGAEPRQHEAIFNQDAPIVSTISFKEAEVGKPPELIVENYREPVQKSLNTEQHESSTTRIHISEENTSRPMITIQNIQINRINSCETHETKASNDEHFTTEKSDYARELMKKHYKLTEEDAKDLSRPLTERFKGSSIFAKLTQANQKNSQQQQQQPPQRSREAYINTNLRSNLSKEALKHKKNASVSDFNLMIGPQSVKNHHSPKSSRNTNPGSLTSRRPTSPESKSQPQQLLKANDKVNGAHEPLKSIAESTFKFPENVSTSRSKSPHEAPKSLGKTQKPTINPQNKMHIQKYMQKPKNRSNYTSSENSLKIQTPTEDEIKITTEATPSSRNKLGSLNGQQSMNKFGFNLNLGSLNTLNKPSVVTGITSCKSGVSSYRETPLKSQKNSNEKQTPRFPKESLSHNQTNQAQLKSPSPSKSSRVTPSHSRKVSRSELIQTVVENLRNRKASQEMVPDNQLKTLGKTEKAAQKKFPTNLKIDVGPSVVKKAPGKKITR